MERVTDANENILDVFENDIELYLEEFKGKQGIDDFRSVPQSVWNGALMYVKRYVFADKRVLKQSNNTTVDGNIIPSNFNAYNYDTVNQVVDYYIYLCALYNKEVSIIGFSNLTGIEYETIYLWGESNNKLSTSSFNVHKKLVTAREESLSNKLADGKQNPVGVIAMLNRHYGWASPYTADSRKQQGTLSASELPKLGGKMSAANGQIEDKTQIIAEQ